jgi:pimeloyl-ACP methyl ester carboxylesterase
MQAAPEIQIAKPPDDGNPIRRDYAAASDVLLVVFSGLKKNPRALPGFSFKKPTEGILVKKLFLRDLDRAWFLKGLRGVTADVEETVAFLRAEAKAAGARRIVLTGYSLGGFAALLYGALLGAEEVQAISPQTFVTFWRRLRCGDHRWRRYVWRLNLSRTRSYQDLQPILQQARQTQFHVHFARDSRCDPYHAGHVRGLPGVTLHEYPEGGHRLVTALHDNGELRRILSDAVAGESLRGSRPIG